MTWTDYNRNPFYSHEKNNSVLNNFVYVNSELSSLKFFIEAYLKEKKLANLKIVPILLIRGGGKKRKKKNYTKPKKIKHIKKKIKLKILSYYSVNKDSVSRLRKESPESQGCFMANHKDRITCGKTGITYIQNLN